MVNRVGKVVKYRNTLWVCKYDLGIIVCLKNCGTGRTIHVSQHLVDWGWEKGIKEVSE